MSDGTRRQPENMRDWTAAEHLAESVAFHHTRPERALLHLGYAQLLHGQGLDTLGGVIADWTPVVHDEIPPA